MRLIFNLSLTPTYDRGGGNIIGQTAWIDVTLNIFTLLHDNFPEC